MAGLNLTVVDGGVNRPPAQLVQTAPVRAPVRSAPVAALGPAPAELGPVARTVQPATAAGATRAAPVARVPLRRVPKNDRN
jgi:hypothetical protein